MRFRALQVDYRNEAIVKEVSVWEITDRPTVPVPPLPPEFKDDDNDESDSEMDQGNVESQSGGSEDSEPCDKMEIDEMAGMKQKNAVAEDEDCPPNPWTTRTVSLQISRKLLLNEPWREELRAQVFRGWRPVVSIPEPMTVVNGNQLHPNGLPMPMLQPRVNDAKATTKEHSGNTNDSPPLDQFSIEKKDDGEDIEVEVLDKSIGVSDSKDVNAAIASETMSESPTLDCTSASEKGCKDDTESALVAPDEPKGIATEATMALPTKPPPPVQVDGGENQGKEFNKEPIEAKTFFQQDDNLGVDPLQDPPTKALQLVPEANGENHSISKPQFDDAEVSAPRVSTDCKDSTGETLASEKALSLSSKPLPKSLSKNVEQVEELRDTPGATNQSTDEPALELGDARSSTKAAPPPFLAMKQQNNNPGMETPRVSFKESEPQASEDGQELNEKELKRKRKAEKKEKKARKRQKRENAKQSEDEPDSTGKDSSTAHKPGIRLFGSSNVGGSQIARQSALGRSRLGSQSTTTPSVVSTSRLRGLVTSEKTPNFSLGRLKALSSIQSSNRRNSFDSIRSKNQKDKSKPTVQKSSEKRTFKASRPQRHIKSSDAHARVEKLQASDELRVSSADTINKPSFSREASQRGKTSQEQKSFQLRSLDSQRSASENTVKRASLTVLNPGEGARSVQSMPRFQLNRRCTSKGSFSSGPQLLSRSNAECDGPLDNQSVVQPPNTGSPWDHSLQNLTTTLCAPQSRLLKSHEQVPSPRRLDLMADPAEAQPDSPEADGTALVLCTESFLESNPELVAELSRTKIPDGRYIELLDCVLVDHCGVSMELPKRQGISVLSMSIFLSPEKARAVVLRTAELCATTRFLDLFLLLVHDVPLTPIMSANLFQLQSAIMTQEVGATRIHFKSTSSQGLTQSIAEIVNEAFSRKVEELSGNAGALLGNEHIFAMLEDEQCVERARFLLNLLPLLSSHGALEMILWTDRLAETRQDGSVAKWSLLFSDHRVRRQIHLFGKSVHPDSITQLSGMLTRPLASQPFGENR